MNDTVKIKVCGLTQLNQVQELMKMNIDFLGFIFYKNSPRFVLNHLRPDQLKLISHHAKTGIFVNETIENIAKICSLTNLNFVQLHGDETSYFISNLRKRLHKQIRIIKAFRIGKTLMGDLGNFEETIDYFLFDTDSSSFGGSGKTFDWGMLDAIKINKPYFLSGGVSLDNIIELKTLKQKPYAVDINSKFEIQHGIKDLQKIKLFKSKISHYEL